jgi:hypothetical protein
MRPFTGSTACWFYEQKTRSQVLIESKWDDAASEAGAGIIRFRAWGERADELIEQLLRTLQTLLVGQSPEIKRIHNAKVAINAGASVSSHATVAPDTGRLDNLEIPVRHELPPKGIPEIFVRLPGAMIPQKTHEAHGSRR